MWRTSEGDRILVGHERALFIDGLGSLVSCLTGDDEWLSQVPVFDRLTLPEKFAILEQVADALLHEDVAAPELTAVSEGAVGAVYEQIEGLANVECDDRKAGDETRRLLIAAVSEGEEGDLSDFVPAPDCTDYEEWHMVLEIIRDKIFWDRDWLEEFFHPDAAPAQSQAVRDFADITPEYYTAVPVDPNPEQLRRIREKLRQYVRGE